MQKRSLLPFLSCISLLTIGFILVKALPPLPFLKFFCLFFVEILAINRGEEQKVLTVKINMPDGVTVRFTRFAHLKFVRPFFPDSCRSILEKSIEDSFDRLVQPQMCRHIRHVNLKRNSVSFHTAGERDVNDSLFEWNYSLKTCKHTRQHSNNQFLVCLGCL